MNRPLTSPKCLCLCVLVFIDVKIESNISHANVSSFHWLQVIGFKSRASFCLESVLNLVLDLEILRGILGKSHGKSQWSSNLSRSQSSFIPRLPRDFTKPQLPWSWDWWPNTWAKRWKKKTFRRVVKTTAGKPISKEKRTKLLPSPWDSVEVFSHRSEWKSHRRPVLGKLAENEFSGLTLHVFLVFSLESNAAMHLKTSEEMHVVVAECWNYLDPQLIPSVLDKRKPQGLAMDHWWSVTVKTFTGDDPLRCLMTGG